MKEEKIKALPFVKEFSEYFIQKAKRALKLRNKDFDTVHIDYYSCTNPGTIYVWFHRESKKGIVGKVSFTFDGKQTDKTDNKEEAR